MLSWLSLRADRRASTESSLYAIMTAMLELKIAPKVLLKTMQKCYLRNMLAMRLIGVNLSCDAIGKSLQQPVDLGLEAQLQACYQLGAG